MGHLLPLAPQEEDTLGFTSLPSWVQWRYSGFMLAERNEDGLKTIVKLTTGPSDELPSSRMRRRLVLTVNLFGLNFFIFPLQ